MPFVLSRQAVAATMLDKDVPLDGLFDTSLYLKAAGSAASPAP